MNIIKTEIKNKTRALNAKWSVTLDQNDPDYDPELEKEFSKILQEEIDWEIMIGLLKEVGYTHITMPWPTRMDEVKAHTIKEWCRDNLKENYQGRGQDWLFKSEKDATMFVLKWA
jgi:hypothetical protein